MRNNFQRLLPLFANVTWEARFSQIHHSFRFSGMIDMKARVRLGCDPFSTMKATGILGLQPRT